MRGLLRLFLVACVGALSAAASAEDAPSIRAFDIATIETMGRAIYDQDQFAAKASDILVAKLSQSELKAAGVKGWVTATVDGKQRVRFVGGEGDKVEALYDVIFADGVGTFAAAADRTLTPEEAGQHAARTLARTSAANKCSSTYNTVALKDPAGDGWLVWALAASSDADAIIIGGHIRFTISADGGKVAARDDLSKGCMQFSRQTMMAGAKDGAKVAGLMLRHLVSLTPVETHVFTQLSYQFQIVIGTQDGRSWKVDGGRITSIDMDSPGFEGFAARTLAGVVERCFVIARVSGAADKYVTGDAPSVILSTERDGPYTIKAPSGYEISSLMCGRLDIVPAPNDYKVVVAGYPLYIADVGAGHPKRLGVVEISGGQFRFRMTDGPDLDDELRARMERRLKGFQNAVPATTVSLMRHSASDSNRIEALQRQGQLVDGQSGLATEFAGNMLGERAAFVTGDRRGYAVHLE